ncbi:hypothetical protein ABIC09_003181 [Bradyrhizobium sp. S3.12.5]|uniref:hypothetical protein n=1 Tax=Bradyrhizobium sp. S3.12.5 TaxID=3156386 RepID=UPI00339691E0
MPFATAAAGIIGRIAATMSRKAWDWGLARSSPLLSIKMEEIDAGDMLRAFDITLRNVSAQSVRLRELFISQPTNAQFAIRWRPLGWAIDEGPRYEPWDIQSRYDLATSLDPGEEYDCEIGIPAGFAISQSRVTPVTISLKMVTLGIEERVVVQDIKRKISLA